MIKPFRKGFVLLKENASEQLQSVIKLFLKGFVKEKASDQLQSVIWPFLKVFVRETASSSQLSHHCRQSALDQIETSHSVIKPFLKGLVMERASEQVPRRT